MPTRPTTLSRLTLALVATTCLGLASSSSAQVYKTVDKSGNVSFSDQPTPDAEPIELPDPNTTPAITITADPEPSAPRPDIPGYSLLQITQPTDSTVIANGLIAFEVTTAVQPTLQDRHQLQLSIDGKAHSTSRTSFTINRLSRGEHQLQVAIIDSDGNRLQTSAPITVFVYRPSSN